MPEAPRGPASSTNSRATHRVRGRMSPSPFLHHVERHACFAHLTSVPRFGALPVMRSPTLNTLAANHVTTHAARIPTSSVRNTCHAGGGVEDPRRIIIANVLT